jgi:hypothetical protein
MDKFQELFIECTPSKVYFYLGLAVTLLLVILSLVVKNYKMSIILLVAQMGILLLCSFIMSNLCKKFGDTAAWIYWAVLIVMTSGAGMYLRKLIVD